MRHQSTGPVSPAPGEFLPRGRRPQEADRRGVYDGPGSRMEANKKLIRQVIITRAAPAESVSGFELFRWILN